MALGTKPTIFATGGAVVAWVVVLLIGVQLGYSYDSLFFLVAGFWLPAGVLLGLALTLLFVLLGSAIPYATRILLALVALIIFVFLSFWGGLFVSCANGNCL